MSDRWTKHPGLYRLFEVGHVVGADMNREFMFEAEDRDTNGVTLVRVYSRLFDVGCAPCEGGGPMKPSTRLKARAWRYAATMLEEDVAARPGLPNETIKDREAILEHIVNSIIPSLRTRASIIARRKP